MTDTSTPTGPETGPETGPDRGTGGHRSRRRALVTGAIVVVLAAAAVLDLAHPFGADPTHPFSHPGDTSAAAADDTDPVATEAVTRRTLSARTTVDATLGYAGTYPVTNHYSAVTSGGPNGQSGSGSDDNVVTWLPQPGDVIEQGQPLYRVDGVPVILLYGSIPAYRALAASGAADDVTGPDVKQLNHDLVALGYVDKSDVDSAWNEFTWATKDGVEKLQHHDGLDGTGALDLGAVVFLPKPVRVTDVSATLGAAIGPGQPVFTGTSTTRQVSVDLDTSDESEVKKGDHVSVTLPNGHTTPGVVSTIGTVASSSSSGGNGSSGSGSGSGSSGSGSGTPTVEVDVTLTHPAAAGTWDQAPVEVTITTDSVQNALAVPVTALVARSTGGYAVEVVTPGGTRRLVPVTLGLFDDTAGLVQVTGTGLTAGQHVVVPTV